MSKESTQASDAAPAASIRAPGALVAPADPTGPQLLLNPALVYEVLCEHIGVDRVSNILALRITSIIEYLFAEILELAGNAARNSRKSRIDNSHIIHAVFYDDELCALLRNAIASAPTRADPRRFQQQFTYLLAQIHPDMHITQVSKTLLVSIFKHLVHRFASQIENCAHDDNPHVIETICDAILPGELARHAKIELHKNYRHHYFEKSFTKIRAEVTKRISEIPAHEAHAQASSSSQSAAAAAAAAVPWVAVTNNSGDEDEDEDA